ncbi:single-stranded DNA-binding protein 4 isoform X15 [Saccopteryx bilineata]|uniref:single-stranded DNA-binding protein 4 isoform X15 n=1 Tax=Saccopteryx bilineata TaxID=59482 RepID=UPI00338F0C86
MQWQQAPWHLAFSRVPGPAERDSEPRVPTIPLQWEAPRPVLQIWPPWLPAAPPQPQRPHDGASCSALHVTAVPRGPPVDPADAESASCGPPQFPGPPPWSHGPLPLSSGASKHGPDAEGDSFTGRGQHWAPELRRWHAAPTQLPCWPRPAYHEHIPYSASSPGSYTGPPGGGGPPGTPIIPSPGDSTNSSENMYTIMNSIGPGAGRANFPLDPGPEGPMAAMSTLEPHHVNGSLGAAESHVPVCLSSTGSGDIDGLPKSSPGAMAGLSTTPGTPRNDGEMAATGTFLHLFPSESVSDCVDSPPAAASGRRGLAGRPRQGGRGARARP